MHFFVVFKKLHVILQLDEYKNHGKARAVADDCMDAGGRATQEQLPREHSNYHN
jgi:hypothetical protein